jgi:hypothetical protein
MAGPAPRMTRTLIGRDVNVRTQGAARIGRLPRLARPLFRPPRLGCVGHQPEERAFNSERDSSVTAFGQ